METEENLVAKDKTLTDMDVSKSWSVLQSFVHTDIVFHRIFILFCWIHLVPIVDSELIALFTITRL